MRMCECNERFSDALSEMEPEYPPGPSDQLKEKHMAGTRYEVPGHVLCLLLSCATTRAGLNEANIELSSKATSECITHFKCPAARSRKE